MTDKWKVTHVTLLSVAKPLTASSTNSKDFRQGKAAQTSRYKWKEKISSEIQFRRKLLPESTPKKLLWAEKKAQKGGAQRVTYKTDRFQGSTKNDPNHLVVIL